MGSRCPLRKHRLTIQPKYWSWVFVHYVWKLGIFFSPPVEIEPFSPYCFLFLLCFVKTACNLGKTTENASHMYIYILSERVHGVGIWFVIFPAGGRTLWTVDHHDMHSRAAVLMTTLMKCCNLLAFLTKNCARYMAISGTASLYSLCCCPLWAVFLTLSSLFVCTV